MGLSPVFHLFIARHLMRPAYDWVVVSSIWGIVACES
jgi:hypothetical protein